MNLYGPFQVRTYVGETLSDQPATGFHYTTDLATFIENQDVLGPFRVYPNHPLQYVMAGDDPVTGYPNTVALCFPDLVSVDQLGATITQLVMTPES